MNKAIETMCSFFRRFDIFSIWSSPNSRWSSLNLCKNFTLVVESAGLWNKKWISSSGTLGVLNLHSRRSGAMPWQPSVSYLIRSMPNFNWNNLLLCVLVRGYLTIAWFESKSCTVTNVRNFGFWNDSKFHDNLTIYRSLLFTAVES